MSQTIELLAPAGSLEKLKVAVEYGADAVYAGGKKFGLRTASENFTLEDFREGAQYVHDRGAKIYVTMNTYARSEEIREIGDYAAQLENIGIDGIIVSDLGVLSVVKEAAPSLEIHISTQANIVNYAACRMWHSLGASRVVLARELSLAEIEDIRRNTPESLELEAFVHGAMCISYSGRCLLSNYMTGRDSNRGDCAQPCRWKYALVEEKRPGQYFSIGEDEKGSFVMNSKDLCLLRRIPELVEAGVKSFKIEGRVKSEFYVATVVGAYRRAIDTYLRDPEGYQFDENWYDEVYAVSHREYFEGFADGLPENGQVQTTGSYIRGYEFVAFVDGYDNEKKLIVASQRNKFYVGDDLEILIPKVGPIPFTPTVIYNESMESVESTPHADARLYLPFDREIPRYSMIRKKSKKV